MDVWFQTALIAMLFGVINFGWISDCGERLSINNKLELTSITVACCSHWHVVYAGPLTIVVIEILISINFFYSFYLFPVISSGLWIYACSRGCGKSFKHLYTELLHLVLQLSLKSRNVLIQFYYSSYKHIKNDCHGSFSEKVCLWRSSCVHHCLVWFDLCPPASYWKNSCRKHIVRQNLQYSQKELSKSIEIWNVNSCNNEVTR